MFSALKKFLFALLLKSNSSFCFGHDICAKNVSITKFLDRSNSHTPYSAFKYLEFRKKVPISNNQILSYGYTDNPLFMSFNVKKAEGVKQKCYLELASSHLNSIEIWKIYPDGRIIQKADLGTQNVFTDRLVKHRNFIFPFALKKNHQYIIKVNSKSTLQFPVKVYTKENFIERTSADYLFIGLFAGLLILFALWGCQNFFALGELSFLFYVLYSLSILVFFLERDGISYQFLFPDLLWWKPRGVRIFALLSGIFGVLYASSFLGKRFLKNKLSMIYCLICVLSISLVIFLDVSLTPKLTILGAGLSPIIMLYLSLKGMKYGPLAKYLALGAAANILGVVVYSLSVLNITAASFLAEYSMKIAVIVEFFLLSIGITHKIKNYAVTQALASILSHEVRRPLDKFDRVLKRISNAKDEKLKQYLESSHISEDLEVTQDLVKNILDINQRPKLNLALHKVEDIVFKLINNYPLVKLETDFRAKSLILVDKPKIKRVVEIILDNAYEAIKHKKNEHYIQIQSTEDNSYVWLSILNTGSCISRNNIKEIFTLFQSFGKSNGRGIGLSIAEKTIKAHKGSRIFVESNGVESNGLPSNHIKTDEDYVIFWIRFQKTKEVL